MSSETPQNDTDEIIQLICPICRKISFEEIYLAGQRMLKWERQGKIAHRLFMNKVEAYRCLHCDYVVMFARE